MTPMEFKREVTRILSKYDDNSNAEERHGELDDLMEQYILESDSLNQLAIEQIKNSERWYS